MSNTINVAWDQEGNVDLINGSRFVSGGKLPYPASVRSIYQCSVATDSHETSYVAIIGSELSSYPRGRITGGDLLAWHQYDAKTFLVVELSASGIHWMEPRDICVTGIDTRGSIALADVRDRIMRSIVVTDRVAFLDREATLTHLDDLALQP